MSAYDDPAGWIPTLSKDGLFYCSPRCGGGKFCRREWYDAAVRSAESLADRMGRGWTTRVWENLGWHYSVQRLSPSGIVLAEVYANEDRRGSFDAATGYPVSSYSAFIQAKPQFVAHAARPDDALGFALQDARTAVANLTSHLNAMDEVMA